ncbi:MAG: hypothetical protein PVJ76_12195 [Gemmatimonadota bacterium]|jgi:hypothetical protein
MRRGAGKALRFALLLLTYLPLGCGGDSNTTGPEGSSLVTLSLTGLKPLGDGLNYQAWLIAGTLSEPWGSPLALFDVDQDGRLVDPVADTVLVEPLQGRLDPADVIGVAVSLETSDTLLSYSSYTFLLGGDLVQGTATLTTEHWIAFDASLTSSSGRFVLKTPTDADQENELGGIWFIDTGLEPVGPGLELPGAPEGWVYEGWVVVEEVEISTGKFLGPTGADSANTYSGSLAAPAFPGEDFLAGAPSGLVFPPDLSGALVFVTMEPWMEWDVGPDQPFPLRILEAVIPADAAPLAPYEMLPLLDQLPSGTVTVQGG